MNSISAQYRDVFWKNTGLLILCDPFTPKAILEKRLDPIGDCACLITFVPVRGRLDEALRTGVVRRKSALMFFSTPRHNTVCHFKNGSRTSKVRAQMKPSRSEVGSELVQIRC